MWFEVGQRVLLPWSPCGRCYLEPRATRGPCRVDPGLMLRGAPGPPSLTSPCPGIDGVPTVKVEKAMAPHSSTLAWKIPWTEGPGRLQSMESLSRTRLSDFTFTFCFHALEKEMATHSSVLAWRIPGMGEPGGLPSMGSHRVGHDGSNLAT